jgi:hypothetical protein
MRPSLPALLKYLWGPVVIALALLLFSTLFKWDLAQAELKKHPDAFALLVSSSSKTYGSVKDGKYKRSDTYLMLPRTVVGAYTLTVSFENGKLEAEEDEYGAIKLLGLLFIVLPLLNMAARRLGLGNVRVNL